MAGERRSTAGTREMLALLALGATALAPESRAAAAEDSAASAGPAPLIERYLEEERHGDALRASELAVREEPRSATLWHLRGQVLRSVFRFEEAIAALERSLELDPEAPEVVADVALIELLVGRGAEAAARLRAARRRWPANPELRYADDLVDMVRQALRDWWRKQLEPGSPQQFAQEVMLALYHERYLEVLLSRTDPAAVDRWIETGPHVNLRAAAARLIPLVGEEIRRHSGVASLDGFVVSDEVTQRGDHVRVGVNAVFRVQASEDLLELAGRAADDPLARLIDGGPWITMLRGLPPADRAHTVAALRAGFRLPGALHLELVQRAGAWKLVDIHQHGLSLGDLVARAAARTPAAPTGSDRSPAGARGAAGAPPRGGDPSGGLPPLAIGLVAAAAAALVVLLLLRLQARRGRPG